MKNKSFIKWVGGKERLLPFIRQKYPSNVEKYCEPFVGGGSVLFDIIDQYNPKSIIINDSNPELINVYKQIKTNVGAIIERLALFQKYFLLLNQIHRKRFYKIQRDRFNHLMNDKCQNPPEKASLFIFLNKTCFNGLYRVNSDGLFNVPIGFYEKPIIFDEQALYRIHKQLQPVKILCGDYQNVLPFIDSKTFIYADPPYRPLTATSCFVSYSKKNFDDNDQKKLKLFADKVSTIGAKILISNSDPKNANPKDNFFDKLYSSYNIERVPIKRTINRVASKRNAIITELLISNY